MAFVVIYTPRTSSKRPAILVPQAQAKIRKTIKSVVEEAVYEASRVKGSESAWKPFKLSHTIGVSVPVRTDTGERAHEIYLLCGIDTAKVDDETLRSVQSRLANQTVGLADGLITTGIPWGQRGDPHYRAQFVAADTVVRNELSSYGMMFTNLPEVADFRASKSQKRNNWVNWAVVLVVPLLALAGYLIIDSLKPKARPIQSEITPSPTPVPSPAPFVPSTAEPKPIAMANPFEGLDLPGLERTLKELREMRERLAREKEQVAKSPETLIRWEREAIRFNRRRQQLIDAFHRLNTEAGQGSLEAIFIEDYGADLHQYPERMLKAREDLESIRGELVDRRSRISPSDLPAVEDYNDSVEWFNLRAGSFNRAVERAKTFGKPEATSG